MHITYIVWDSINRSIISRHRLLRRAVEREEKENRYWDKKGNGSCIPMKIMVEGVLYGFALPLSTEESDAVIRIKDELYNRR